MQPNGLIKRLRITYQNCILEVQHLLYIVHENKLYESLSLKRMSDTKVTNWCLLDCRPFVLKADLSYITDEPSCFVFNMTLCNASTWCTNTKPSSHLTLLRYALIFFLFSLCEKLGKWIAWTTSSFTGLKIMRMGKKVKADVWLSW